MKYIVNFSVYSEPKSIIFSTKLAAKRAFSRYAQEAINFMDGAEKSTFTPNSARIEWDGGEYVEYRPATASDVATIGRAQYIAEEIPAQLALSAIAVLVVGLLFAALAMFDCFIPCEVVFFHIALFCTIIGCSIGAAFVYIMKKYDC